MRGGFLRRRIRAPREDKHHSSWVSVSVLTNRDGVEGLDNLAANIAQVALR